MEFKDFLNQGWRDHADQAEAVATRLPDGLPLIAAEGNVAQLAALALHVYCEHLGRWQECRDFLARLSEKAISGLDQRALARSRATIDFCCEAPEAFEKAVEEAFDESLPKDSPRVRALAVAASACAAQGKTALAMEALDKALAAAAYGPQSDDPAAQGLAMAGNNLACELEEKATRSDAETELMLRAARIGREYWAIAGGWLETERAEYRLARSHVAAGLGEQALKHARSCLEICKANQALPFETFFAWEAMIWAAAAAGDKDAQREARKEAEGLLLQIIEANRGYAQDCLDKAPKLDS